MIIELLNFNKVCKHDKVSIDADFSYCPDCGELIENQWYIARCATCGIKLKAFVNKHGEIVAQDKFCHNCGSKGYIIERLNKLNFIDIQYAVLVKAVITKEQMDFTQSWIDERINQQIKLCKFNEY